MSDEMAEDESEVVFEADLVDSDQSDARYELLAELSERLAASDGSEALSSDSSDDGPGVPELSSINMTQLTRYVIEVFPELDGRGLGDEATWILTTYSECEGDTPYARQWERTNADGQRELTCGHTPEHVILLG